MESNNKPLNLLITNTCNQNCKYCFASEEMREKSSEKYMSMDVILQTINKQSISKEIKLLGGEPTLHPKFSKILEACVKKYSHIQIFSNAIFSDTTIQSILKYKEKIGMTVNIMTPGYQDNKKIRELVRHNISTLVSQIPITLSLTVGPFTDVKMLFSGIPKTLLRKIQKYRIGLANPIAFSRNDYSFEDFPKIGEIICELLNTIEELSPQATSQLNCGFTRCMFSQYQLQSLINRVTLRGFGCFGKGGIFDVSIDNKAFHCFPLSNTLRISMDKSIEKIHSELQLHRMAFWKKFRMKKCVDCPFYIQNGSSCPGPCIAFIINSQYNEK